MKKSFTQERKHIACMLASYVAYIAGKEEKDSDGDFDSIQVYCDCVDAADKMDLFLTDDNLINVEDTRNWANDWARKYYEREVKR